MSAFLYPTDPQIIHGLKDCIESIPQGENSADGPPPTAADTAATVDLRVRPGHFAGEIQRTPAAHLPARPIRLSLWPLGALRRIGGAQCSLLPPAPRPLGPAAHCRHAL